MEDNRGELEEYRVPVRSRVCFLEVGDHFLKSGIRWVVSSKDDVLGLRRFDNKNRTDLGVNSRQVIIRLALI